KKQAEILEKKRFLEERRVNSQIDQIKKSEEEIEKTKAMIVGQNTEEEISALIFSNTSYIRNARAKLQFINEDFDNIVPFFPGNFILMLAKTGEGKSTATAN